MKTNFNKYIKLIYILILCILWGCANTPMLTQSNFEYDDVYFSANDRKSIEDHQATLARKSKQLNNTSDDLAEVQTGYVDADDSFNKPLDHNANATFYPQPSVTSSLDWNNNPNYNSRSNMGLGNPYYNPYSSSPSYGYNNYSPYYNNWYNTYFNNPYISAFSSFFGYGYNGWRNPSFRNPRYVDRKKPDRGIVQRRPLERAYSGRYINPRKCAYTRQNNIRTNTVIVKQNANTRTRSKRYLNPNNNPSNQRARTTTTNTSRVTRQVPPSRVRTHTNTTRTSRPNRTTTSRPTNTPRRTSIPSRSSTPRRTRTSTPRRGR